MKNNVAEISVAVVCAIIIVGTILVPQVDNSTAETNTYYNDGLSFTLADADDTDTHTILISLVDEDYVLTLDDEEIDDSYFGDDTYTILFSEHGILRYAPITGGLYFGGTQSQGTATLWRTFDPPTDGNPTTISIVGDSATVTGLIATVETTYGLDNDLAYVSNDGDYVYGYNPCVTSDSFICGGGVTYSPFSSATVICFNGTIDNLSAGVYRSSPTVTIDSVEVNTTEICTDLVQIDSIVFDCTQSDTSKTVTYTYFLAPYEVVYENPDYIGETESVIIGIIPLFMILAILCIVTYAVMRNRD